MNILKMPGDQQAKPKKKQPVYRYEVHDAATGRTRVRFSHRPPIERKRSDLPMPHVIQDRVEYMSMIDGTAITGRRQHREHLAANGCEEVGTEKLPMEQSATARGKRELKETLIGDIKDAYAQAEAGYVPEPEPEIDDLAPLEVTDDVKTGDIIRA